MEEIVRIIIVPAFIMLGGFLLEISAMHAKGKQRGPRKFKLWLRRADESCHCDWPCGIEEIKRYLREGGDRLVDIIQLASFEDYAGISFDLCISAFTADIIVLFNEHKVPLMAPRIAATLALHFLLLVWIVVLVTANQRVVPNHSEVGVKRRTVQAIGLGFFALVSSLIALWEAL